jgi:hypothetical protein
MTRDRTEIEALLPLPPATFHILVALADQDRHGYAIIQDVERHDPAGSAACYRAVPR